MGLPSRPESKFDIAFFRNTGLALILTALVAGAITISLTLTQNPPIVFADKTETKAVYFAAGSVTVPPHE